jgi:hypothetical protein
MAKQPPKPQTPEQKTRDAALLKMIGGGLVMGIGVALYIWGSPTQPGQRRNALWLALEQAIGYEGTCMLFVIGGAAALGWGLWQFLKVKAKMRTNRGPHTGA